MNEYQRSKKQVEASLDRLSRAGLIGKSYVTGSGERVWSVGPRHQAIMLEILRHPERWDEVPAFRNRKAELHQLRKQAIAQGLIY